MLLEPVSAGTFEALRSQRALTVEHGLVAGSSDTAALRVACGVVKVRYGDSIGLFQRLREVIVADLSGYPQVRVAFETILAEQNGVCLLRHLTESPSDPLPWLSALEGAGLGCAIDLIFDRSSDRLTAAILADATLMSRTVFAARFHAAFGCIPMSFVHEVRLRKEAGLLTQRADLSIDQIAVRAGFTSRSHLSRTFKSRFGMGPAAFRLSRVA